MTERPRLVDRLPLQTPHLALRRLSPDDGEALAAMLADPVVMRFFPRPMTRREADLWLRRNLDRYERDGTGLFAVTRGRRWIGDCGFVWRCLDDGPVLELGYHFARHAWGHGYATEAARACLALADDAAPGLPVVALIRGENRASRRVAARLRFTIRGAVLHAGLPHERWAPGVARSPSSS